MCEQLGDSQPSTSVQSWRHYSHYRNTCVNSLHKPWIVLFGPDLVFRNNTSDLSFECSFLLTNGHPFLLSETHRAYCGATCHFSGALLKVALL